MLELCLNHRLSVSASQARAIFTSKRLEKFVKSEAAVMKKARGESTELLPQPFP